MDTPEHDPTMYGSSFAEVYDTWYPGGDDTVLERIGALLPSGARLFELGVGTGRLALPLARAGYAVTGLDSSPAMAEVLRSKDPEGLVEVVLADAGRPDTWPEPLRTRSFDCVLAACNLLLNLASSRQQEACVSAAASMLAPDGVLLVELDDMAPPGDTALPGSTSESGSTAAPTGTGEPGGTGEHFALSTAGAGVPVVVSTELDPRSGSIDGQHIELHDDGGATVRPWRVHPVAIAEVDLWCDEAGLALESRSAAGARTVTVYRR